MVTCSMTGPGPFGARSRARHPGPPVGPATNLCGRDEREQDGDFIQGSSFFMYPTSANSVPTSSAIPGLPSLLFWTIPIAFPLVPLLYSLPHPVCPPPDSDRICHNPSHITVLFCLQTASFRIKANVLTVAPRTRSPLISFPTTLLQPQWLPEHLTNRRHRPPIRTSALTVPSAR